MLSVQPNHMAHLVNTIDNAPWHGLIQGQNTCWNFSNFKWLLKYHGFITPRCSMYFPYSEPFRTQHASFLFEVSVSVPGSFGRLRTSATTFKPGISSCYVRRSPHPIGDTWYSFFQRTKAISIILETLHDAHTIQSGLHNRFDPGSWCPSSGHRPCWVTILHQNLSNLRVCKWSILKIFSIASFNLFQTNHQVGDGTSESSGVVKTACGQT